MEMFNFSGAETQLIKKSLRFVLPTEVDQQRYAHNVMILKTENYLEDCEELALYFSNLGIENNFARLVFNTAKGAQHKILVNKSAVSGLSFVHAILTELVNLTCLSKYVEQHGNIYRFSSEQALADYYYEFLLWLKYHAMAVATRAHALISWHELNGDAPPADGCYQFADVDFHSRQLTESLAQLQCAETVAAWREQLWGFLEELAFYYGRLALYQGNAEPIDVDASFPAQEIDDALGSNLCQQLQLILRSARDYQGWCAQKTSIRTVVLEIQKKGSAKFPDTHIPTA